LSLILLFIGVKPLLHFGHLQNDDIPEIATSTSLLVILGILSVTVVASLARSRSDPDARPHAGSLRATRVGEAPPAPRGT
jgi:predicted tellurium resistance membrane protein TerC